MLMSKEECMYRNEITSIRREINFIGHAPDIEYHKSDYMYFT